jgi:8-oxo-dGTP pyrophosphatase MutT (NUDIX family)
MAKRAPRKTTPSRSPARRPGGPGAREGAPAGSTRFEISAGGVIYRRTATGIAVCLISTKGGARWQLPKGKREPGESLEQTAAREVAEETGLVGEVGPRLDRIDLWFTWNEDGTPIRHHKLVYFYLLRYRHGSTADHDHEVDEARWFPAEEAITRLTFPNERRVVARALELLAAEPEPAGDPARAL